MTVFDYRTLVATTRAPLNDAAKQYAATLLLLFAPLRPSVPYGMT